MSSDASALENWLFGLPGERRFTQDSPVLPEVWLAYSRAPGEPQDLLLTPHKDHSPVELLAALSTRLVEGDDREVEPAYNEGYVVARLHFYQLVREVVPLSKWWASICVPGVRGNLGAWVKKVKDLRTLTAPRPASARGPARGDWLAWYLALLGRIELGEEEGAGRDERASGKNAQIEPWRRYALAGASVLKGVPLRPAKSTPLWTASLNREAVTALSRSRLVVKADAAERVFSIGCGELRWAIVDTGIDATHPAFGRRGEDGRLRKPGRAGPAGASRVVATYDFTRLRSIVAGRSGKLSEDQREELEHRIKKGRALDWDALEPLLRVPREKYEAPKHGHGTHVAGIVGGDWRTKDGSKMPAEEDLIGICPDIELYDLRVFDADGKGKEFAILGALQFVKHLNSRSDLQVIHGVNLSVSLYHRMANYAVGRTPICDECERLTASGVVVAAAAGNDGQARYTSAGGTERDGFRTVAITDPGNAESVITVGSTHRQNPHTYGVSYFSSRGPTGDGRAKPDLVAPGEKIASPVPGSDFDEKDGTSQATAHVSGVAAMLMARNPELIAQPRRIKEILCGTATDLGRERYFQGAGLIDALRALQEV
jgi:hypothetical protein